MKDLPGLQAVLDFVERNQGNAIGSTGAAAVTFSGGLYNVQGSTYDPHHVPGNPGSWMALLAAYNIPITSSCYVTNPLPSDPSTSHPTYSKGGHMTINQNGGVTGGTCYLMPLCAWHNNSSRIDLFSHTGHDNMVKLTGYMTGELAATFQIRMPCTDPFAILYHAEEGWTYQNLSKGQAANLKSGFLATLRNGQEVDYVLFERVHGDTILHYIRHVNLPSADIA